MTEEAQNQPGFYKNISDMEMFWAMSIIWQRLAQYTTVQTPIESIEPEVRKAFMQGFLTMLEAVNTQEDYEQWKRS